MEQSKIIDTLETYQISMKIMENMVLKNIEREEAI